jgi:hypothetical protein
VVIPRRRADPTHKATPSPAPAKTSPATPATRARTR